MGTISAAIAAFTGAMEAIKAYLSFRQNEDMQELGQLRQENALLKAQNQDLSTRLSAVMRSSGSGSDKL